MKTHNSLVAVLCMLILMISVTVLPAFANAKSVPLLSLEIDEWSRLYCNDEPLVLKKVRPLNNLSNDSLLLVEFENIGYAILLSSDNSIVEAGFKSYSPYEGISGIPYYAGPLNYLELTNKGFVDIRSDNLLTSEQVDMTRIQLVDQISRIRASTQEKTLNNTLNTVVTVQDPGYFASIPFGYNVQGTCGSVAAGMALTYIDRRVGIGRVVPLSLPYGEPLHQELIPYIEQGPGGSSTSYTVTAGINGWFNANAAAPRYLPRIMTSVYNYVIVASNLLNWVSQDRPCILALAAVAGSPYGNHMVTAYGASQTLARVHVGWHGSGYHDVYINTSCAVGISWIRNS